GEFAVGPVPGPGSRGQGVRGPAAGPLEAAGEERQVSAEAGLRRPPSPRDRPPPQDGLRRAGGPVVSGPASRAALRLAAIGSERCPRLLPAGRGAAPGLPTPGLPGGLFVPALEPADAGAVAPGDGRSGPGTGGLGNRNTLGFAVSSA